MPLHHLPSVPCTITPAVALRSGHCQSGCIRTFSTALRGQENAALSVEVQLHAGDLGRLINNPEDRRKAAQAYIESVAVAVAISGGGALSSFETTVLMSVEESMEAMRKVGEIKYRPPGT